MPGKSDKFGLAHIRIFWKGYLVVLTFMSLRTRYVNVTRTLFRHLLLYFSLNASFYSIHSRDVGGGCRVMREAIGISELHSVLLTKGKRVLFQLEFNKS